MAKFSMKVDASKVLDALDHIMPEIEARCLQASYVSAVHIKYDAQARVARRTSGKKTTSDPTGKGGLTARGIAIERSRVVTGYIVRANRPEMPNLPLWLEKGTVHMKARPFLVPAAQLEAGAHERRIREAIDGAIEDAKMGRH